jgi:O-antigen/teichoic acid export membrane protein
MSTAVASAPSDAVGAERRRPRLESVDRRDAALMSIGTLASGVLAYVFNVLAARTLGPDVYGGVGALWAGMFLLAVFLYRPLEQTLSRAISDHVARGGDARPAVRSAARLGVAVAAASSLALLAAWGPITDGLFDGRAVLTAALVVGLAGYGVSYFVRGLLGGVRWFGGYGMLLLADGAIRVLVALPLLFVASPAIAAVAIALAAIGGGVAPALLRERGALRRIAGDGRAGSDYPLGSAIRFAGPAAIIAGCEQVLVSGGPLLVLIAGGEGAAHDAGVLFAATLLVRAPVFVFQGIQASLLPNLTTFEANGERARLHHATVTVALILAGFAAVVAVGALAVGPTAMSVMFGDGFDAGRTDLAAMAVGIGGFLAAGTFCQALLARGRAARAAFGWAVAAVLFVVLELVLPGSAFHRVSLAFGVASLVAGGLSMASVWRSR